MFILSFCNDNVRFIHLKIDGRSVYLKMYVVRNILLRKMLTCFYQKLLFRVTVLSFLYSGVWIRQICKVDSAMILNDVVFQYGNVIL